MQLSVKLRFEFCKNATFAVVHELVGRYCLFFLITLFKVFLLTTKMIFSLIVLDSCELYIFGL